MTEGYSPFGRCQTFIVFEKLILTIPAFFVEQRAIHHNRIVFGHEFFGENFSRIFGDDFAENLIVADVIPEKFGDFLVGFENFVADIERFVRAPFAMEIVVGDFEVELKFLLSFVLDLQIDIGI